MGLVKTVRFEPSELEVGDDDAVQVSIVGGSAFGGGVGHMLVAVARDVVDSLADHHGDR